VKEVISGGMGNVFVVTHKIWNRRLVIKTPNDMAMGDESVLSRIFREATAWTQMGLHPHIAYCYYVRKYADVPLIFIEYIDGGDLSVWIDEKKCENWRMNLDLAIQFCHGMSYAHKKGMIHRDIKPANILITHSGILKITDFGLVRTGSPESYSKRTHSVDSQPQTGERLTMVGTFMGSEGYMAPEQAHNPHSVDGRADIFSFGVCLYEMFCGEKPYTVTIGEALPLPDPVAKTGCDPLPDDLADIMKKCLQWQPENRYADFDALRTDLCRIYERAFNIKSPFAEIRAVGLEADGLNNQGVSYMELDCAAQAVACWECGLVREPGHPALTYNLALAKWRAGEIDDLETLRCLDQCRSHPDADTRMLAESEARIHGERLCPDAARQVLSDIDNGWETVFGENNAGEVNEKIVLHGHKKGVSSVSVSDCGYHGLSGDWDGRIFAWNMAGDPSGKALTGHAGPVSAVDLSTDGKTGVSVGHDAACRIWDIVDGCQRYEFGNHSGRLSAAAISPDGRLAACGGEDGVVYVYNAKTGSPFKKCKGHDGGVKALVFIDNARFLASAGADGRVKLWDLSDSSCRDAPTNFKGSINTLAINSNRRWLLWGGSGRRVYGWDMKSDQCRIFFRGHRHPVVSIAVAFGGKLILSAGWGGHRIRIWEMDTGRCVRTLEGHSQNIASLSSAAHSPVVLSGGWDRTVRVWSFNCREKFTAPPRLSKIRGYDEQQAENTQVAKSLARVRQLVNARDYRQACDGLFDIWGKAGFRNEPAITDTYEVLAKKGRLTNVRAVQGLHCVNINQTTSCAAMDKTADTALFGGVDGRVRLWHPDRDAVFCELNGHNGPVSAIAVSGDGRWAITSGRDREIRRIQTDKEEYCGRFRGNPAMVHTLSMNDNGQIAVSGGDDFLLRVWDVEGRRCLRVLSGHDYHVNAVALSAGGHRLLSGGADRTVCAWHTNSGKPLWTRDDHTREVSAVALTPDGKLGVSADSTGTIVMREMETGEKLGVMQSRSAINTLHISKNGRWLVTADADQQIKLWDIIAGCCAKIITTYEHGAVAAILSENSRKCLTAGGNGRADLWSLIRDLDFTETDEANGG
jgi:WD40 repeat protein